MSHDLFAVVTTSTALQQPWILWKVAVAAGARRFRRACRGARGRVVVVRMIGCADVLWPARCECLNPPARAAETTALPPRWEIRSAQAPSAPVISTALPLATTQESPAAPLLIARQFRRATTFQLTREQCLAKQSQRPIGQTLGGDFVIPEQMHAPCNAPRYVPNRARPTIYSSPRQTAAAWHGQPIAPPGHRHRKTGATTRGDGEPPLLRSSG